MPKRESAQRHRISTDMSGSVYRWREVAIAIAGLCLSQGGTDATLDCRLQRWPEVGFGEIAINLPQSRFRRASGWRTIEASGSEAS
jgi:hypothetical protein